MDASVFPSGLKAAAIVDLGGGKRGQYLAVQRCRDCDSALYTVRFNRISQKKNTDVNRLTCDSVVDILWTVLKHHKTNFPYQEKISSLASASANLNSIKSGSYFGDLFHILLAWCFVRGETSR